LADHRSGFGVSEPAMAVLPGVVGGVDDTPLLQVLDECARLGLEVWGHAGVWCYGAEVFPELAAVDLYWEPGDPPDPDVPVFPHAYGAIATRAVTAVLPYLPGRDGSFAPLTDVPDRGDLPGRSWWIPYAMALRQASRIEWVTGGFAVLAAGTPESFNHNQLVLDALVPHRHDHEHHGSRADHDDGLRSREVGAGRRAKEGRHGQAHDCQPDARVPARLVIQLTCGRQRRGTAGGVQVDEGRARRRCGGRRRHGQACLRRACAGKQAAWHTCGETYARRAAYTSTAAESAVPSPGGV